METILVRYKSEKFFSFKIFRSDLLYVIYVLLDPIAINPIALPDCEYFFGAIKKFENAIDNYQKNICNHIKKSE